MSLHAAQEDLSDWMKVAGQQVRVRPTPVIPDDERVLRARLVLEEALEFVEAMGCTAISGPGGDAVEPTILINPRASVDVVEAADAIADIMVVTIGSACTLGVEVEPVYEEVMESNWQKFPEDDDGVPQVLRDVGGKVIKPEHWSPPDIASVLRAQGWAGE